MADTVEAAGPPDLNLHPHHDSQAQQRSDHDAVEVLSPANALRRPEQASPVPKDLMDQGGESAEIEEE